MLYWPSVRPIQDRIRGGTYVTDKHLPEKLKHPETFLP